MWPRSHRRRGGGEPLARPRRWRHSPHRGRHGVGRGRGGEGGGAFLPRCPRRCHCSMVRLARRTVPPARPGRDARGGGGGATEAPQPSTRRSSARRRRGRRHHGNNPRVPATNTRPRANPPRLLYSTVHNSLGAAPVHSAARSLSHSPRKAHAVRCPAVPPRRRGMYTYSTSANRSAPRADTPAGERRPWPSGPACAGGGERGSDAAAAPPHPTPPGRDASAGGGGGGSGDYSSCCPDDGGGHHPWWRRSAAATAGQKPGGPRRWPREAGRHTNEELR